MHRKSRSWNVESRCLPDCACTNVAAQRRGALWPVFVPAHTAVPSKGNCIAIISSVNLCARLKNSILLGREFWKETSLQIIHRWCSVFLIIKILRIDWSQNCRRKMAPYKILKQGYMMKEPPVSKRGIRKVSATKSSLALSVLCEYACCRYKPRVKVCCSNAWPGATIYTVEAVVQIQVCLLCLSS
jgi:hypothetical protein